MRESVAQVLQRQFRDVGVDMAVQLVDGTSISGLWFEGNFDAMLHWWQMPSRPRADAVLRRRSDRRRTAATSTTSRIEP